MVQRTVLVLEDDLDGGKAEETVRFSLDGVSYEIDLNEKNASQLREALAPWVGHARRAGGRRTNAQRPTGGGRRRSEGASIRAWAQEQGYKVSDRGRVSEEIREAYAAAHS